MTSASHEVCMTQRFPGAVVAVGHTGTVNGGMPMHRVAPDKITADVRTFPPAPFSADLPGGEIQQVPVGRVERIQRPLAKRRRPRTGDVMFGEGRGTITN